MRGTLSRRHDLPEWDIAVLTTIVVLFENFDHRALARTRRGSLHHRTQSACSFTAATDNFAKVFVGNFEFVHVRIAFFDKHDVNIVRLIDQILR